MSQQKKGQGVRRRTHREKGKKSEHDTKARTRRLVRFPSAPHTRTDTHTGPHQGVSQRCRCSSAKHSRSKGLESKTETLRELKDLFMAFRKDLEVVGGLIIIIKQGGRSQVLLVQHAATTTERWVLPSSAHSLKGLMSGHFIPTMNPPPAHQNN